MTTQLGRRCAIFHPSWPTIALAATTPNDSKTRSGSRFTAICLLCQNDRFLIEKHLACPLESISRPFSKTQPNRSRNSNLAAFRLPLHNGDQTKNRSASAPMNFDGRLVESTDSHFLGKHQLNNKIWGSRVSSGETHPPVDKGQETTTRDPIRSPPSPIAHLMPSPSANSHRSRQDDLSSSRVPSGVFERYPNPNM